MKDFLGEKHRVIERSRDEAERVTSSQGSTSTAGGGGGRGSLEGAGGPNPRLEREKRGYDCCGRRVAVK